MSEKITEEEKQHLARLSEKERILLAKRDELNASILEKISELNEEFRGRNLCLELKIIKKQDLPDFSQDKSGDKSELLCLIDSQTNSYLSYIKYSHSLPYLNMVYIDSFTQEPERGKGYNLLLRAIIILGMETFVKKRENQGLRIKSIAKNVVSIYTLIKYFGFTFQGIDPSEEITIESLKKYEHSNGYLVITDEALDNARAIISRLLESGKIVSICMPPEGKGGKVFRKKCSHKYRKTKKTKGKKTKRLSSKKSIRTKRSRR